MKLKPLILISCLIALSGCNLNSCEESGGKLVFTHYLPIYTGKITIMQPMYGCEHSGDNK